VRIFPKAAACFRLIRAVVVEMHEKLDRSHAVPAHGTAAGAEKGSSAEDGLMRGKKVPPLLTKGRGLNRRPKNDFAELDQHN
jgi:hypothetical protein